MKTIGIVAEYNPFHLGHAWQIRESRRILERTGGETAVIAVMSGDFVQRGEAAARALREVPWRCWRIWERRFFRSDVRRKTA